MQELDRARRGLWCGCCYSPKKLCPGYAVRCRVDLKRSAKRPPVLLTPSFVSQNLLPQKVLLRKRIQNTARDCSPSKIALLSPLARPQPANPHKKVAQPIGDFHSLGKARASARLPALRRQQRQAPTISSKPNVRGLRSRNFVKEKMASNAAELEKEEVRLALLSSPIPSPSISSLPLTERLEFERAFSIGRGCE